MVVLCALLLAEKGKFRPLESGGLLLGIKSGECDIFLELILDKLAIIRQRLGCYHPAWMGSFSMGPSFMWCLFLVCGLWFTTFRKDIFTSGNFSCPYTVQEILARCNRNHIEMVQSGEIMFQWGFLFIKNKHVVTYFNRIRFYQFVDTIL